MSGVESERTKQILERCGEEGFAMAGVCAAQPSAYGQEMKRWLAEGKHGSMEYLERGVERRLEPGEFVPGTRSLVLVADQYWSRDADKDEVARGAGRIARYARGRDYHKVMKKRLHSVCDWLGQRYPGETFRAFVDTAPILEREHAVRAGLGWIGKHTLLIHPARGSYVFLGGIATSLVLELPAEQEVVTDHCGTCTRCIDACPTGAITEYSVDGSKCISALTIEERGEIPFEFHEAIGDWLYGCDICQEVCPHNSARDEGVQTGEVYEAYAATRSGFDLLEVLEWYEEDRSEAFVGSAMKRATLSMMRRNAVIVAGNALRGRDDGALRSAVQRIAADGGEDEIVRIAAQDVVRAIDS